MEQMVLIPVPLAEFRAIIREELAAAQAKAPTAAPAADARLLSTKEAAAVLGCSVQTVYDMVAEGKISPARRLGRGKGKSLRFRASDLVQPQSDNQPQGAAARAMQLLSNYGQGKKKAG